ncbi:Uncharacterised protein [Segatella copri]|nr:Uncharacterised protein [Segatella copri]
MSMSEGRPVFKAGVAVAPPTCYRFYDSVYTERYMRTPKENEEGYKVNPIERVKQQHGACRIPSNMLRRWFRQTRTSRPCGTRTVITAFRVAIPATICFAR